MLNPIFLVIYSPLKVYFIYHYRGSRHKLLLNVSCIGRGKIAQVLQLVNFLGFKSDNWTQFNQVVYINENFFYNKISLGQKGVFYYAVSNAYI